MEKKILAIVQARSEESETSVFAFSFPDVYIPNTGYLVYFQKLTKKN